MSSDDASGNVQTKGGCDDGISAITHTNRSDKTSISFDFEYLGLGAGADLLLEVTVVRERAQDNWFYSAFPIQIGDGGVPVTPAPVTPTPAPVKTTSAPVGTPSSSSCTDPPFRFRVIKPDGSAIWRDCGWGK